MKIIIINFFCHYSHEYKRIFERNLKKKDLQYSIYIYSEYSITWMKHKKTIHKHCLVV
jgi:hypothetical protein